MTLRALLVRLQKAWTAFHAPPMERVLCACGTWFCRVVCPQPDTKCDECRAQDMDVCLTRLQETGRPLW